jgi:hypothetical protein
MSAMKTERAGKSHAMAWALSVILVPVLYLLSVPPVVCFTYRAYSTDLSVLQWLGLYQAPYGWMARETPLRHPMEQYYEWWMKRALS